MNPMKAATGILVLALAAGLYGLLLLLQGRFAGMVYVMLCLMTIGTFTNQLPKA